MEAEASFRGRLAVQQRVLPFYRATFLKLLAEACQGGLSVFSGKPQPEEQIRVCSQIEGVHLYPARNFHFFSINSPLYRCWQAGILDWLNNWNPDALIVEANPRYPSTFKAIRWMHARGRPVIGWGLGAPLVEGVFAETRIKARHKLLNSLDGVIAYSQRGACEYRQFGLPTEKVFTAFNAVVARPQFPPPFKPNSFINQPIVLYVGRLQRRKRLDLLFQACASLSENIQPVIWIVGDGPASVEFREAAARTYPYIEFCGELYDTALEERFRRADIFVLPGTGGLAIQQAMSFGLPVIAAQGDGTQDDLVRTENGWKVVPGDVSSLKSALIQAFSDPGRLRTMGAASYRIVAEEVNLERMRDQFVAALNSWFPLNGMKAA